MADSPEFTRWQDRYAVSAEYVFGTAPNEFLARCKHLLPESGTALAVADGEGRNSVWLAEQGLNVVATDFSPAAQNKAQKLATDKNVRVQFIIADAHHWDYTEHAFDVVVDIFTQFSSPQERPMKWDGMRRTLKPGGLLIVRGYAPKQLDYNTGGPKVIENLYTRDMLEAAFGDYDDIAINEEERELSEGAGHAGMSALIGLTARKPR